jgi:hypothetical protein
MPVAGQYEAMLSRLGGLSAKTVTPELLNLLLGTGQMDLADQLAPQLSGDDPAALVARA